MGILQGCEVNFIDFKVGFYVSFVFYYNLEYIFSQIIWENCDCGVNQSFFFYSINVFIFDYQYVNVGIYCDVVFGCGYIKFYKGILMI